MKKKIIAFFKKHPGSTFKAKDVAKKLDITDENEYSSLKAFLHKLSEEEVLIKTGKRYSLNNIPTSNKLTGKLQVTQGGYGFVIPSNNTVGDIFVASRNLGTAFNGDTVDVLLFGNKKGKNYEGQIVNVIKRKKEEISGTLQKSGSFYFLKSDDPDFQKDIYISKNNLKGAKVGDKAVVGKIEWNSNNQSPEGEIVEVIGKVGSPDAELISIAREFNLPYKFPDNVLNEAELIPFEISEVDFRDRMDFRNARCVYN